MTFKIIKIHTTTSTNDLLKEMQCHNDVEHGTVIWALNQTKGRGQRGNSWQSEEGKNLTFSILVKFDNLELSRQFELNQVVSLAVLEVLKLYLKEIQIKWPNDILADKKKIAGILIENTVQGTFIKNSILGIGLNVNQTEFDASVSHASSMKNLLHSDTNLESLLNQLIDAIACNIKVLETKNSTHIQSKYLENLIGWQEMKKYATPDGNSLAGKIVDVLPNGKLVMETKENEKLVFGFQEVKMDFS